MLLSSHLSPLAQVTSHPSKNVRRFALGLVGQAVYLRGWVALAEFTWESSHFVRPHGFYGFALIIQVHESDFAHSFIIQHFASLA